MTVLVGGLRVLGANAGQSPHGVFTISAPASDQRLLREPARHGHEVAKSDSATDNTFEGRDRADRELKWTGTGSI
jgi:catalase-peroxidase